MLMPIVMLPGLICDSELWRAQVEGLADLAAVNIPNLTLDDGIGAMAARVLAAAPAKFALIGLSMGGYVAFEIMRQAPERVTRLALLSTSAATDSEERAAVRRSAIQSLNLGQFRGVTDRILPSLVASKHTNGPIAESIKAMADRVGTTGFLNQQKAILSRLDSRPVLSTVGVPTLVAVGENDILTPPSEAEAIQRGIPNSRLHVFRDCGHLPPLECPDETTILIRQWLELSEPVV